MLLASIACFPVTSMTKRGALGEVSSEDRSKPVKISKPSLDSDEEDYQEADNFRLREGDIDGQENATLEYDEDIKITPFNMREELEEDGYFDGNGNFIFKKKVDARDNWLEDIDWVEVNKQQIARRVPDSTTTTDAPDVSSDMVGKMDLYQNLLSLMRPKETVLRSIKRMGAPSAALKAASASQRWLKKKQTVIDQLQSGDPEGLLRATELADQLLQGGEFDVYQMTYEQIEKLVRKEENVEPEDELDALGHAIDSVSSKPEGGLKSTND
ncbi:unnamed protein product [Dicrocoelium dendriticum]|nr:unnamed protein product [Dicrocoelium dendriticum]